MIFQTTKKEKGPQSALIMDWAMIRMAHPFDWKKLLDVAFPGTVSVQHAGKVYYHAPKGALTKGSLKAFAFLFEPYASKFELCYYIVDDRTAVFDREPYLRPWLEGKGGAKPTPAWAEDWKQVEPGLLAFALENRDCHWLDDRRQPEEDMPPALITLFRNSVSLAFGADYADGLVMQAQVRSDKEPTAMEAARALLELMAYMEKGRAEEARKQPPQGGQAVGDRVLRELLAHSHIELQGTEVHWHSAVKVSFADLITAWTSDMKGK
jgi:hypothetical protein